MALQKFPDHIKLLSRDPIGLTIKDGRAEFTGEITYPEFYVFVHDFTLNQLKKANKGIFDATSLSNSGRVPAIPSDQGLAWDPHWAVFSAFYPDGQNVGEPPFRQLVTLIGKELDWKLKCPILNGPESLIGQWIAYYGQKTGGDPNASGYNPSQIQREFPIAQVLAPMPEEELRDFRDRGRTLLDLAMEQQQWELAEFLWTKGVRWSESAVEQGKPLASLTLASLALQGSLATGFLEDFKRPNAINERIEWVQQWLDRWTAEGCAASLEPAIDYRGNLARLRGWEAGSTLRDNAPSFWIARFCEFSPQGKLLDPDNAAAHMTGIIDSWAKFWADQGVDLSQVSVQVDQDQYRTGIAEFWNSSVNNGKWARRVDATQAQRRLELGTGPAMGGSSGRAFRL